MVLPIWVEKLYYYHKLRIGFFSPDSILSASWMFLHLQSVIVIPSKILLLPSLVVIQIKFLSLSPSFRRRRGMGRGEAQPRAAGRELTWMVTASVSNSHSGKESLSKTNPD